MSGPRAGRSTPSTGSRPFAYQPALDGLRAVAVTAVLVFHAGFHLGRGGFLGVSTFFTLSGFLITSLLLADSAGAGRPDLARFWSRRARRLLPGAWLALGAVLLYGATVADATQLSRLRGDVLAALAYVANWRFVVSDQSYADLFRSPSPALHFWSLAIEEQFYLVFPLLLTGLLAVPGVRSAPDALRRRRLALALAAGALSSTAWMVWLDGRGVAVDRLYYGTDTRAAELLVGAVLACVLAQRTLPAHAQRWLAVAGPVALGVLVGLYATTDLADGWLYRGGLLGIALLAAVVIASLRQPGAPLARALRLPPLRRLGVLSYGTYLFHWPVFLWLRGLGWAPGAVLLVGGALTVGLAAASYALVEDPIRHARRLRGLSRTAVPATALTALLVATWAVTRSTPDDPLALLVAAEAAGPVAAPTTPPPVVPGVDRPLRLLVVGDRPAAQLVGNLRDRPEQLDIRDVTGVPCGSELVAVGDDPEATTCAGWVEAWGAAVEEFDPDVTLVAPAWWDANRLLAAGGPDAPALDDPATPTWLRRRMSAATDLLASRGGAVAVAEYPHPLELDGQPAVDEGVRLALGALHDVAVSHPDAHLVAGADELGAPLVASGEPSPTWSRAAAAVLAPRLLELGGERAPEQPTRVMVVGDSVSWFVGRGLERWARDHPGVQVWNTGTLGCGVARGGELQLSTGPTPSDPTCDTWPERWSAQLEDFDPDAVVVLTGLWDLADRRLPEWDGFHHVGEPVYDRYLLGQYEDAVDLLGSEGATVLWLNAPCYAPAIFPGPLAGTEALSAARQHTYNTELLPELAARTDVRVLDLAGLVCPDGRFTQDFGGLTGTRPDGVHFSDEAADAVAGWLAPQLPR